MKDIVADSWYPEPYDLGSSEIIKFMSSISVDNLEDLKSYALNESEQYWKAVLEYCQIEFETIPTDYVDVSAGKEFPAWFPGAKLNYVNTVLSWASRDETADNPAVIAESEDGSVDSLTYRELELRVRQFGAGLTKIGVSKGDCVGLLMENGIEATISLLGVASTGAIVVPLFSGFGVDPIVARLSAAEAKVVIGSTGFERRGKTINTEKVVLAAVSKLESVQSVIWKGLPTTRASDIEEFDWHEIAQTSADLFRPLPVGANDPFMVIYTSGTTGQPKGIVHTHGGFPIKIAHDAVVHFDVRPGDVFCWPADIGWIAGTLVMCSALMRGASLVSYDGAPDFPDWSRMSQLVERHQITHFGSAPTLIRGLATHEGQALEGDRSSIRLLITAGEAIDRENFLWFQNNFAQGSRPLINYTGGTEASGALLSSVVIEPIVPGGFNTVSPGVDAVIVDSSGHEVAAGEVGELAIRSPFLGMTHSFWHDDERYLNTYWETIPGLWVHGDLVTKGEGDAFFVVGRSDDTIKVAGKRLGPAEVEDIALTFSEVSEAAAIGVNDDQKGQRLVLFIVLNEDIGGMDNKTLTTTVAESIGERLGRPFKPSKVYTVDQLPKTRSSKIMRRVLRNAYCGLPLGDLSSLDNLQAIDAIKMVSQRK
jgi:acetyl-CoA synthetase